MWNSQARIGWCLAVGFLFLMVSQQWGQHQLTTYIKGLNKLLFTCYGRFCPWKTGPMQWQEYMKQIFFLANKLPFLQRCSTISSFYKYRWITCNAEYLIRLLPTIHHWKLLPRFFWGPCSIFDISSCSDDIHNLVACDEFVPWYNGSIECITMGSVLLEKIWAACIISRHYGNYFVLCSLSMQQHALQCKDQFDCR